jgi:hypothetical protein
MAIKLTQLSCKYGAPMGRANDHISGKCKLQKCPMVDGGAYDNGGAYWGIGTTLWVCQDSEGGFFFVRAKSRNEAKKLIQEDMLADDVTFYR